MTVQRLLLCAVAVCFLATPILAADQKDDLPSLKTKVKTLAVFKNGLGFVFRAGDTKLKDGWAVTEEIPVACLGTLWIGTTSKAGPVQEVIAFKDKTVQELEAVNLAEILAANVGQSVTISYSRGGNAEMVDVKGTILAVPTDRKADDLGLVYDSRQPYPNDQLRGQIVLVRDITGSILALNKTSILSVRMPDNAALKAKITKDINRAKVRIGGKPASAEITMAYLEKGITWSPSYLVNVENNKEADITLEAVLSNDVEDLENVDVSFVVGYPNFMFADSMSPLALQQSVAAFVQGLLSPGRSGGGSGITGQSVYQYQVGAAYSNTGVQGWPAGPSGWSPNSAYSATQPMAGESNEDLYFYKQDNVTLKKGERARYTVFTGKAPYEHIYQWDIPDTMYVNDQGYRPSGNQQDSPTDQIWHALRIENTTGRPWTTAPGFMVNGSMPVAQDMLKYTPAGGKSTLKMTVATDIQGTQTQTEASRTPVPATGYANYDDVTVNGVLTVKNWKKIPIKISVKKSLTGEVKEAGQGGTYTKVVKSLTSVNPTSEIVWEFTLAPGESKELSYQYKALVHR
jgi:hypothetical protein